MNARHICEIVRVLCEREERMTFTEICKRADLPSQTIRDLLPRLVLHGHLKCDKPRESRVKRYWVPASPEEGPRTLHDVINTSRRNYPKQTPRPLWERVDRGEEKVYFLQAAYEQEASQSRKALIESILCDYGVEVSLLRSIDSEAAK